MPLPCSGVVPAAVFLPRAAPASRLPLPHPPPVAPRGLQEVQVLAHLPPHPNVVRYTAAWAEAGPGGGEHVFIQLEKCDVSLDVHCALGERIREGELLEVMRQVGGLSGGRAVLCSMLCCAALCCAALRCAALG